MEEVLPENSITESHYQRFVAYAITNSLTVKQLKADIALDERNLEELEAQIGEARQSLLLGAYATVEKEWRTHLSSTITSADWRIATPVPQRTKAPNELINLD